MAFYDSETNWYINRYIDERNKPVWIKFNGNPKTMKSSQKNIPPNIRVLNKWILTPINNKRAITTPLKEFLIQDNFIDVIEECRKANFVKIRKKIISKWIEKHLSIIYYGSDEMFYNYGEREPDIPPSIYY